MLINTDFNRTQLQMHMLSRILCKSRRLGNVIDINFTRHPFLNCSLLLYFRAAYPESNDVLLCFEKLARGILAVVPVDGFMGKYRLMNTILYITPRHGISPDWLDTV